MQEIVRREFERAATDERADIHALSQSLKADLGAKGLQIVEPDKKAFKDALAKANFYKDLRTKFGEAPWKLLQDAVGALG
jgi:TRAP-type C4-dicarboxylate transport system substrate-binding protein